jgi:hypothetical protein
MKKIVFSLLVLHCFFSVSAAIEIKSVKEFTLSQNEDTFVKKPGSIIVTEDDMVFVLDSKEANIKVFDKSGKLVDIFGRKGMGPNEFVRIYSSSYKKPYVIFADFGRKSFFLYKRLTKKSFEFVHKFLHLEMAYDFHLIDDKSLLVAGYKMDSNRKEYNLYEFDFRNKKYDFILTSESAYGCKTAREYRKKLDEKLAYIGLFQFCDYTNDSIYLVWTGNINVIKINRKTKETKSFGKITDNYIQPYLTPEIKKAYDHRDHRLIYKLINRMSYVKDIFVLNSGRVGVVYVGPLKKNKGLNVLLQLYNNDGKFIKEFEVLNANASYHVELNFYFRKDKNLFYILDTETSEEYDQLYKIHEYRIEE